MSFLSFLDSAAHKGFNFLKDVAVGTEHTVADAADVLNAGAQGVEGLTKIAAANLTHNTVARNNAVNLYDPANKNSPVTRSLNASRGTFTPQEAMDTSGTGIIKPIARNVATYAPLAVAPEAGAFLGPEAGLAAKTAFAAGSGATIGGTASGVQQLATTGHIDPRELAKQAAIGGALGGATEFAIGGAQKLAKLPERTQLEINKKAGEVSGLAPDQNLHPNEVQTLGDYADYKSGRDVPKNLNDVNDLISKSRVSAQHAGVDITSGSPAEIDARITDYIDRWQVHNNTVNKVLNGGYIGGDSNPFSKDTINNLAKATDVTDVKKQLDGVIPKAEIDQVAPAIASTKDPNVIDNILNKKTSIAEEPGKASSDQPIVDTGKAPSILPSDTTPVADTAYKNTVDNGGVTISLEGKQPSQGLAYAPDKTTEVAVPKSQATPEFTQKYMNDHAEALAQPGNHLGMWEDNGQIYYDVSKVGDNTPTTMQDAINNNQLAVHDLSTHEDIPIGQIGENGVYSSLHGEATNHPHFNQGQDLGASAPGTNGEPANVPKSQGPDTTAQTPAQKVIDALRGSNGTPIDELHRQQAALYGTERAARLAKARSIDPSLTGSQALEAQLGSLKGSLPRVDSKALVSDLQSKVSPEDVQGLLDTLRTSDKLDGYEPITAQNSLSKLFSDGRLPTPNEWELLQKGLGSDFTDSIKTTAVDSLSSWQKVKNFGTQVLGMPKAVMASLDLSGGGRQGALLGSRFMPEWFNAQKESVKYFASKQAFVDGLKGISERENVPLYKKAGLDLPIFNKHEEQFASTLAEKIPVGGKGIEASDRAYTGGLGLLRADSFDHIVSDLKSAGIDPESLSPKALKDIGTFINTASGRGNLGVLEKHATSLGEALFSPRLWKSRLDMLNPVYYAKLDPIARKYALQSAASFASIAGVVLTMAAAAGAKVETDARSSDFLKIKVGNTRYDILGGFQQNLVLLDRELSGEKKSSITGAVTDLSQGGFGAANRLSILSDFIKNKENPVISTAQTLIKGTDQVGNPVNPATEIGKLFLPLNIADTYKTANDATGDKFHLSDPSTYGDLAKGLPTGLVKATVPGTVGVGVGTYGINDITPSKTQQVALQKLQKSGAPQDQVDATKLFFQTLKAGPSRQNASDAVNKAIEKYMKTGSQADLDSAHQLAQDFNKAYAASFKDWASKYGQQYSTPELVKAYNSGKINLTGRNVTTRVKAIKARTA